MMAFFGIVDLRRRSGCGTPRRTSAAGRGSSAPTSSGAWITLFMIFNVIWTMFLFRGAVRRALGNLPYEQRRVHLDRRRQPARRAAARRAGGPRGHRPAAAHRRDAGLPDLRAELQAPAHLRGAAQRALRPRAGRARRGQAADVRRASRSPSTTSRTSTRTPSSASASIEDFTWKGLLDFTTCTECGRCQSQCPAWNTEKPLSPKLLIMDLRDHALAKAPYLLADEGKRDGAARGRRVKAEAGAAAGRRHRDDWFYMPDAARVIDPDVLWSCTTCGACVQPVPGRHRARRPHRRHAPLPGAGRVELPRRAQRAVQGPGEQGQPVEHVAHGADGLGQGPATSTSRSSARTSSRSTRSTGCSGSAAPAPTRTAPRRPPARWPSCSTWPASRFGVLGNGETCTGDPARRAGNEFVFQGLAAQNVETFKEYKVKKVVSTCAHCFNTLKNEYTRLRHRARGRAPHPAAQPAGAREAS